MYNLWLIAIINLLCIGNVISENPLREFFFPQHPIVHRIRKFNSTRGFNNPSTLDFIGLVEAHGYYGEEHYLTTEDGYKLIIHRIPGSPKSPPMIGKPVVLLQHGFLASSDFWVLTEGRNNLAFVIADNGYDVWVGNVRGNTYCRSHEWLSTLDPEFWKFSYHEIGFYDLPAIIDYTLNITDEKSIYYIGHSMGTTTSYVLLSTKPIYNDKIKLIISLAPVAYWKVGMRNQAWRLILDNFDSIKMFFDENGIYDVFPLTDNFVRFTHGLCGKNIITQSACVAVMFLVGGSNPDQFNITLLPQILAQLPAGGSVQTMDHFKQNSIDGLFREYDYGFRKNYKLYGKKKPPLYNVKEIIAPVALVYSVNDPFTLEENVIELAKDLPNVVQLYKIPNKKFTHIDYTWSREHTALLNTKVINLLLIN